MILALDAGALTNLKCRICTLAYQDSLDYQYATDCVNIDELKRLVKYYLADQSGCNVPYAFQCEVFDEVRELNQPEKKAKPVVSVTTKNCSVTVADTTPVATCSSIIITEM